MARTIDIFADATYSRITDLNSGAILLDIGGGLGEWSFSVAGNDDLTAASARVAFRHDASGATFGEALFADITSCNIGGVDVLAGSSNLLDIIEGIGSMLTPTVTVALPTGAATAAKQDLLLAELQLKADLTQTQPVSQVTLVSTLNSTTTLLNAAATFTGAWEDVSGYESVSIAVATDQDGTFTIQFSPDGTNADGTLTRYYRTASINPPQAFAVTRKFMRVTFTNTSASNQTYLRLQTIIGGAGLLNIPIDSTMSQNFAAISVRPTDYHHEVALGLRQGRQHWDIWGNNTDIDIGTEIVRTLGGTTVSNITVATTFTFVSSSAADTSAGTGAQSLVVYYIDSLRKAQIGVVTLNGTTPVVSAFSGLGINRISIYLAGTGQANAGTITCTETTSAAAVAEIRTGEGTNQTTVYYIQASATALVNGVEINLIKPTGGGERPYCHDQGVGLFVRLQCQILGLQQDDRHVGHSKL